MSEPIPKGTQAYRWLVGMGTAATVALATLILSTAKETAADVNVLKIAVSTVQALQTHQTARIESVERRNDAQDAKLDGLWQRFWTLPNPPKGNP